MYYLPMADIIAEYHVKLSMGSRVAQTYRNDIVFARMVAIDLNFDSYELQVCCYDDLPGDDALADADWQQASRALFAVINVERETLRGVIQTSLTQPIDVYPLEAALADLEAYDRIGRVDATLAQMSGLGSPKHK